LSFEFLDIGFGKVRLPVLGELRIAEGMPKRFLAGLAIVYVVFLGITQDYFPKLTLICHDPS
jgi:hypothetical protein